MGWQSVGMEGTAFPQPLSIEQIATEALLAERLAELGTEVRWSTEAVALRVRGDGAAVDVRGPGGELGTIDCRWVVGCEGAHSLVRKTLGIPFEGERRENLQAVQINANPEWQYATEPDTTYFFLEHRTCLIASPRPGGGYRYFCFLDDPEPQPVGPPGLEEMRDLVAAAAHDPELRLVPTVPPWFNRARFHDRVAASLRVGPALLAGDSAHTWAPVGGRGLNTGLRGAHNLAWKLASVHHGWAGDALLDTYSTEQRGIALEVMRQMRRNVMELPASRLTLAAMRLAGPALLRSEGFTRRGRTLLSELARHHRRSAPGGGRGGTRAGDRVPDVPVTQGGRQRRLHDLLSYDRWTLLVEGEADTAAARRAAGRYAAPVEAFGIRAGRGHAGVLPTGTMLLVRPDGHVGLRARATDRPALDAYLRRWFTPKA